MVLSFLYISYLSGALALNINVVLPPGDTLCGTNSPFVNASGCTGAAPEIEVTRVVEGGWKEVGSDSNWEYASTGTCKFNCVNATGFVNCQTSAAPLSKNLNFYPMTNSCCVSNCSSFQTFSTRITGAVVQKAYRLPSSGVLVNSTRTCVLNQSFANNRESVYQCTFPDSVSDLDVVLRNFNRSFSLVLNNIAADRWVYSDLISYSEPYTFRFLPQSGSGCNSTDVVLKDTLLSQRVCVGNITVPVFLGQDPYFIKGIWLGTPPNASLASNIQILASYPPLYTTSPVLVANTGVQNTSNVLKYIPFAPLEGVRSMMFVPPSSNGGRIELSELRLDIGNVCPSMFTPVYGSMSCTKSPPETHASVCNFNCMSGFSVSVPTLTCLAPSWTDATPICVPVSCPEIKAPDYGSFNCSTGTYGVANYTSACTFACQAGFTLSHTLPFNCSSSGNWSVLPPTCVNINDCNATSCPVGAACLDGIQRVYCGLTLNPSTTRALTGGSLQAGVIQLSSSDGGATIAFDLTLNNVTAAFITDVSYGNARFPNTYKCQNVSANATGTVTCQTAPGLGRLLYFQITYTILVVELNEVWTLTYNGNTSDRSLSYPVPQFFNETLRIYDVASLYEGNPLIGKTTLGEVIEFTGANFTSVPYPTLAVYYGNPAGSRNFTCLPDLNSPSTNSKLRCKTQSGGQGLNLVFKIVILEDLEVYSGDTYSYPVPPKVTRVSGCNDVGSRTEGCPTGGGAIITVVGVGFASGAKVTVAPPAVTPTIFNNTCLTFVLSPGAGVNLPVVVRATDQDSDGGVKWLSYGPPTVSNITGTGCLNVNDSPSQCPKVGTILTFAGKNFGRADAPVDVLIGTTVCSNVTYLVEHFVFTCALDPGSRAFLPVILIQTGGVRQSATQTVSYFQCQPGTRINDDDGGRCQACPANYVTRDVGKTNCTPCDAGQFSPANSSSCSLCSVGTASLQGQDCVGCLQGFYAPNEGQKIECPACPAGRFSNRTSASECTKCAPGSSQKALHATSCDLCEVGRYQLLTEEPNCLLCKAGSFANTTGMSSCMACAPGSFYDGLVEQELCTLCPTGKSSALPSAAACDVCPAGKMASSYEGASACLDCAGGFYQPLDEQTECLFCDRGMFSAPRDVRCTPCEPGRFAREENSSICQPCWGGSFAEGSGNTICSLCAIGTFSNAIDLSKCTACTPGKYAGDLNSSICLQCVPGRAQSLSRQASCDVCAKGKYFGSLEATNCDDCIAGTFANTTNSTTCYSCDAGRYSTLGQASCLACAKGKVTLAASQGVCSECSMGTYSSVMGASVCTTCAFGQIQELSGQTFCRACEAGKYANFSYSCVICPAGKYSNSSSLSLCRDCYPGSFSNQNGRSSCELCLPGTYLDTFGQTNCKSCPLGTISRGSSATRCEACEAPKEVNGRDCVCPLRTYLSEDDRCPSCPKGASCTAAGLVSKTLKAAAGYWRSPANTYPIFYKCLTLTHCPEQPFSFDPTERDDLNYSAIVCGEHRRGPICALCVDGYKSATVVSTCVDCKNNTKGTALSILIIIGMVIALGITYWFLLRADAQLLASQQAVVKAHGDIKLSRASSSPVDNIRRAKSGQQQQQPEPEVPNKDSKTEFDFDDDDYVVAALHTKRRGGGKETGQIKIMIGFFQIIYNLTAIRNLSWPSGFKMVVSAFSFINLDFIPWNAVGCAVPFNFYVRITAVALSPFVIMTLVFFVYFLPSFWKDTRDFSDHDLARVVRGQKRNQLKKMFLFALFLMYPFISREVLSFFLCDSVDGVDYLVPDFNLRCYDDLWKSWLGPVIVMIAIYPIGCPLTVLLLLYQHAKRDLLDTDFVRIGYGFLYEPYQNPRWWFEFLDMVHKILLTSVLNFFPDVVQLPAALVIIGLYTMAILLCTPYIEDSDDNFHMLAQAEIFNIIMCAWVLQTYTLTPGSTEEVLLSILLCALLFMLVGELLRRFIIKVRPHYHKARRVIRDSRGSNAPGQNLASNVASIESKIEQNAYKLSVDEDP